MSDPETMHENEDEWIEVSKEEFDKYIEEYPNSVSLVTDVCGICEPPMLSYHDLSNGKKWPDSVIAKTQLYDGGEYHKGKLPVYYIKKQESFEKLGYVVDNKDIQISIENRKISGVMNGEMVSVQLSCDKQETKI